VRAPGTAGDIAKLWLVAARSIGALNATRIDVRELTSAAVSAGGVSGFADDASGRASMPGSDVSVAGVKRSWKSTMVGAV